MVQILDGPAEGATLALRRAPIFLRVVIDGEGKVDALDQLDDTPADGEAIHVYRRLPDTWSVVFIRPGGRHEMGEYEHIPDAPVDDLRETEAWRAWAANTAEREGVAR